MSEKKSFLNDISNEGKPESFREEEFIKQKKNLLPSIITASAILIACTVLLLIIFRSTSLPDMNGWQKADADNWASKNNVQLVYVEQYSNEFEAGVVFISDPLAEEKIKRNGLVTLTVSKGADPNEVIEFPDINKMNLTQLNSWIEENKLSGITIKKENSSVFNVDDVIDYEMVDGSESSFIRKNRVRVFVSLGPRIMDETVTVPDFSGNEKSQVLRWAHDNEITIDFTEEFSDFVENGKVISQSIESYTKMNRSDNLTITMSLGKAVKVLNFVGMDRDEAGEAASNVGLTLQYINEISNKPVGTVLDQDIKEGTDIHNLQAVTLTIAVESEFITIPDFIGMDSTEASGLAGLYNISIFTINEDSIEPYGTVVKMNYEPGSEMLKDKVLYLYVSKGNVVVPDFSTMTKPEVDLWAMKNGMNIIYTEVYSEEYIQGALFGQEKTGTISRDETIYIYVSLGKISVGDFTGSTVLDVLNWQSNVNSMGAGIEIKFHTVEIQGMKPNTVVDQTYVNQLIGLYARVDIWITGNEQLTVPDFTGVSEEDFINWCNENNVQYRIEEIYSNEYRKGVLYGQNFNGMSIPEGSPLVIYKSKGNPWIPLLNGLSEIEVIGWVNNLNLDGADIHLTIIYEASDNFAEGLLIRQSISGKFTGVGSSLKVVISSGK